MKITQEEAVDRQTVLHIELEDEDLDTWIDRGYRRVVQSTLIPGFRKGKAPRWRVEQVVGRESLLNEVLDSMLPDVTSRAIDEQELDASGLPRIELLELEPFTFKATIPLKPEVDLGAYTDIRITEEPVEVTEEAVQERLERLRRSAAPWEPADRPVEFGDMVTIDAAGKVDGRPILEQHDAVLLLEEDAVRPFPGFSDNLVGLVSDESKEFTLTIPEDFYDSAIAGKEAQFDVAVKEIKSQILPALDDEFAKGIGDGHESLVALHQKVEEELRSETEDAVAEQYRQAVLDALLEGATVQLPPLMIEHEIEHMEADRERTLSRMNVRMDDYLRSVGKTEDEVRDESRTEAIGRLNRTFVLAKVAELNGIEVSDEEVDERLQSLLGDSAGDSDEESPARQPSDELNDSVRRMLLGQKTMDRLVDIARGETPVEAEPVEAEYDTEEEAPVQKGDTDDEQA